MIKRVLVKLPVLGMLAFAAACGGGDQGGETAAAGGDTSTSAAPAPAPDAAAPAAPAPAGDVVEVKMVTTQNGASGVFEPAAITVKPGQTIRWINDGGAAHNASFPPADNPGKSNLPPAGPYLTQAGQTYEIQAPTEPGTYNYQCDPHAALGMKGTITVQ